MISANHKLIVALDVPTAERARQVFDELREIGCAFKIGLQLFTNAGSRFVRELVERDARVFLDLKFHDIPNTVAGASIEAARLGVWMFNVHAAGGREMMERTIAAVRETAVRERLAQPKIVAVTVLTSSTPETLRAAGVADEPLAQVLRLARLARECSLDGVVASAHEAAAIKTEVAESQAGGEKPADFLVVTPGIRFAAGDELESSIGDDQKRVLTARAAIQNGADYVVVGRPILNAPNKAVAARRILDEINSADFTIDF